jgi:hypothetical protein
MKQKLKKIGLTVLATCCFLFQSQNSVAQINHLPELQETQSNAETKAQIMLSNTEANVEYHRLHPTTDELEAKSNALAHLKPTTLWLETTKKQEILDHFAEILRSAIDTNKVEAACDKLINQPQAVLALKYVTIAAISSLNEAAILLTNPNLNDYVGQIGYQADILSATNHSYFIFWGENGPVQNFHKRAIGGEILVDASFYKNGKLRFLRINSPDSKGALRNEMQLGFNEDGTLSLHWMRPADKKS